MQISRWDQIHFYGLQILGKSLNQVAMALFVTQSADGDNLLSIRSEDWPRPSLLALGIDAFDIDWTQHHLKVAARNVVVGRGIVSGSGAYGQECIGSRIGSMQRSFLHG